MQLTFLQAAVPLTKTYTKRTDGGYDKTSYPNVSKVTSHTEEVETVDAFADALRKHAVAGNCLHTGSLDQELKDESRKGHHNKDEKREWIVLDLDGVDYPSAEALIQELPDAFRQVSYIEQHSPSSGLKPGLNMHLFFLLDREESPVVASDTIRHLNFVTKSLRDKVKLTTSNKILSLPLDWVANKNGRVVYISHPECVGFEDPVPDRIQVVKKEYEQLRYNFYAVTPGDMKLENRKLVGELRDTAGLPKLRKNSELYEKTRAGHEVLKKNQTEKGKIHDCILDSEFIVRCNIDGGDSHAYFYYVSAPTLIRNHKGEPNIYMEAFDPDFYRDVAMPAARAAREKDTQPFVFRNSYDDKYYVGIRLGTDITTQPAAVGSESKIEDYFVEHGGLGVPDPIETWRLEFNPRLDKQWNPVDKVFNTWRRTDLQANAMYRTLPPEVITKIIGHVVGNDGVAYEHFINWLAFIYQRRTKTGTAWIFHGVQGTGKGILVDHVLSPIFGFEYVAKQQTKNLKDMFNIWMESALIVNIDEFDLADAGNESNSVMQNLKMWITDKFVAIRGMHQASRKSENFSNFILTTNARSSLPVDEGDRRISFGARQEERLVLSDEEFDAIPSELLNFAGYLKSYDVNAHKARTCLENTAKELARELGKTSIEEFADAVHDGDLQFFIDGADQETDTPGLRPEYQTLLNGWIDDAKNKKATRAIAKEMQLAYRMLCNEDKKLKLGKFLKIMAFKAVPIGRHRVGGKQFRGWKINWNIDQKTLVNIGGHLSSVKRDIEKELREEILASPNEQQ